MRKFLSQLWQDEAGFVISSELVFIFTLVVLGMIAGFATLRDQVLGELGDLADAVSEFDQSYSISAVTGHSASTSGANFEDVNDFCELDTGDDQSPGALPQCLAIVDTTTGE